MVLLYYMITQQSQIKINLPLPLKEFLESKANKFGMPITVYVKHLILQDVSDEDYPVFQASERTERAYKKAMKDYKEGKTIDAKNLKTFFDNL